jgi:hypothetical protein
MDAFEINRRRDLGGRLHRLIVRLEEVNFVVSYSVTDEWEQMDLLLVDMLYVLDDISSFDTALNGNDTVEIWKRFFDAVDYYDNEVLLWELAAEESNAAEAHLFN